MDEAVLSKINYLSTLSGGACFGAFLRRLFTRKKVTDFTDVEDILLSRAANLEYRLSETITNAISWDPKIWVIWFRSPGHSLSKGYFHSCFEKKSGCLRLRFHSPFLMDQARFSLNCTSVLPRSLIPFKLFIVYS